MSVCRREDDAASFVEPDVRRLRIDEILPAVGARASQYRVVLASGVARRRAVVARS
jgi:hypothetical protein